MCRIVHRLCVILTVIVFFCGKYHCLQLYKTVNSKNDQRNIEEPKIAELSKNEDVFDNIPISVTNLKYTNLKASESEVNLKNRNTNDEIIRPFHKRRISRQATLANGYTQLYPQVPSAPPYGYQSASQQPQLNTQGYNNSQPGYAGYKPTNNLSPYNQNSFNSNHGSYNSSQGSYSRQGPYNANQVIHNNTQSNRPYNSAQGSHYPSQGQQNYNHNPYSPTQRPYNQVLNNTNNGSYNPAAGLNPYGGYPSQKPLNSSNQRYPSYNHTSLRHSYSNIPSHYPIHRPVNNSYSAQASFNNNYPGYPSNNQNSINSPNSATQRTPYNYNPGQNPQNNLNSYQYPGTAGGPSQYPQNTNAYGQNANAYHQYPNSNPQSPNHYPQTVNLSYPQYQPYAKQ